MMAPRRVQTYKDGSTPNVCIVGAGIGGLCASVQLKRILGLTSFTIFERAHDVGGVWLANKYPGCEADTPGLMYSFSFEPNPGWRNFCPHRDEYWRYLQTVAKKYGIYPHVQFRTAVKSLVWNEDSKTWTVTTISLQTQVEQSHEFQIVILGTGPNSKPKYPREFESFTGPVMHSANWDTSVKLENQVVGVVGGGASALQVVPSIAPLTKQLVVYLRNPNHVILKPQWSTSWIWRLSITLCPFILWLVRLVGYLGMELVLSVTIANSFMNTAGSFLCRAIIWCGIKKKAIRTALIPKFPLGYKIPAVSNSYYKTFNRSNVTLQTSHISKIDEQTIVTEDGKATRVDVLILCTGFKIQDYFAPIDIFGPNGINLLSLWKRDRPHTFYGVTCNEAPNLFYLMGPNTAATDSMFMIECQVTFIVNALRVMTKRGAASIQVTASAQKESMDEMEEAEKSRVYARPRNGGPATYLLNKHGKSTIEWPKSGFTYWRRTRRLNERQFVFAGTRQESGEITVTHRWIEEIV